MLYIHNLESLTIAISCHVLLTSYTKPGVDMETSVMPTKDTDKLIVVFLLTYLLTSII